MSNKSKQQCARCGSCTVVCPVFRVTGRETLTARGKLHLLATSLAGDPSAHFQDLFAQCLLCGACEDACSRQLPICEQIVAARSGFSRLYGRHPFQRNLARLALSSPSLLQGLVRAGYNLARMSLLPEESGLRLKLGLLEQGETKAPAKGDEQRPKEIPGSTGCSYFSGCLARYLQPSIAEAATGLAEAMTGSAPHEPDSQVCCGLAAWSAGKVEAAKKLARTNIEVFSALPGSILTSCASCSSHLRKYPALFDDDPLWRAKAEVFSRRVVEFTSFVAANMGENMFKHSAPVRLFYHEPCHLRFDRGNRGRALTILEKLDNVSVVSPGEEHNCCGQGGLFHLGYPELSGKIFARAHNRLPGDVAFVVTTCSGCLLQWQAGLAERRSPVRAVHLAVLLRSCLRIND